MGRIIARNSPRKLWHSNLFHRCTLYTCLTLYLPMKSAIKVAIKGKGENKSEKSPKTVGQTASDNLTIVHYRCMLALSLFTTWKDDTNVIHITTSSLYVHIWQFSWLHHGLTATGCHHRTILCLTYHVLIFSI